MGGVERSTFFGIRETFCFWFETCRAAEQTKHRGPCGGVKRWHPGGLVGIKVPVGVLPLGGRQYSVSCGSSRWCCRANLTNTSPHNFSGLQRLLRASVPRRLWFDGQRREDVGNQSSWLVVCRSEVGGIGIGEQRNSYVLYLKCCGLKVRGKCGREGLSLVGCGCRTEEFHEKMGVQNRAVAHSHL
jgi:hypothetical protein